MLHLHLSLSKACSLKSEACTVAQNAYRKWRQEQKLKMMVWEKLLGNKVKMVKRNKNDAVEQKKKVKKKKFSLIEHNRSSAL